MKEWKNEANEEKKTSKKNTNVPRVASTRKKSSGSWIECPRQSVHKIWIWTRANIKAQQNETKRIETMQHRCCYYVRCCFGFVLFLFFKFILFYLLRYLLLVRRNSLQVYRKSKRTKESEWTHTHTRIADCEKRNCIQNAFFCFQFNHIEGELSVIVRTQARYYRTK